jgi:hypothetical protein
LQSVSQADRNPGDDVKHDTDTEHPNYQQQLRTPLHRRSQVSSVSHADNKAVKPSPL